MKIAIITSGFLPVVDGVTVSGFNRLKKLSQWGHQVILFCPDYSSIKTIYPNWQDYSGDILPGVRIINLASTPFLDIDFERNVSRKSYPTLLDELNKFQPDIIHVDEPERLFSGFFRRAGLDYARKKNIPCVAFFRTNFLEYADDYLSLPNWILKIIKWLFVQLLCWIYNAYDATLIHNQIVADKLKKIGVNNTIYDNLNGFDRDQFEPKLFDTNFFAKQYGIENLANKIKLVFVGRLTPDKGWNFTIQAFLKLAQEINTDNLALIIVGDGEMREEISQTLSGSIANLHLLGRISASEIPALLINSDIYVTTSEKENRSLAIIEGLAAGLPVLAPRAGGIPQDIRDGWNGFLFNSQDYDDFKSKLTKLVEDVNLRKEMGTNSREYISRYTWDNVVTNLVNIWQEQINRKNH